MAGVRIFCNQIIPITDWDHDFVVVKSKLESKAPLPALACFDLLNPLDNSGHGYTVAPNGGQVREWGLHYDNGAVPSLTDFSKAGQGAVSFVTAFRFSSLSRYTSIFGNRTVGAGFNLYWGGDKLLLAYIYPSGTIGSIGGDATLPAPTLNKWYVAAGAFDAVNKTCQVQFSELGLIYGTIGTNFPTNATLDAPLNIGGHAGSATSSMVGDVAFTAFYDGAFTADQRTTMISVGMEVLQDRGLV